MEKDNTNLAKRIFKGGSIVLIFTLLASPLGLLIRIFYSHTLSIEMYGLFYAMLSFFNFFIIYNDLGFGYSVVYFIPKYLKKKLYQRCWNLYKYDQIIELITSIALSLVLCLTAGQLAFFYFKIPVAKNLIYIFSIYFVANSFVSALHKFFVGMQQEKYYSSIEFSRLFFAFLFSIIFWLFSFEHVIEYAIAWAAAYITTAVIYNIILHKKNAIVIRRTTFDRSLFVSMFKYAVPTLMTNSVNSLISSLDIFFLTLFYGVREVGVYNVIFPIVATSTIFLSPLNLFFLPLISHLMEGEKDKVRKLFMAIIKYVPFIVFYFSLFIIMFPSAVVSILFGNKWISLATSPLQFLAAGYFFTSLSSYLSTFVCAMGYVKERLKIALILAAINLVAGFVLIKHYGLYGAVITNIVINIFAVFLYSKVLSKAILFKYPLIFYLKLVIFGVLIFIVSHYFKIYPNNLFEFITAGIIYTSIILILAYWLKLFDRKMLKLFIKK